MSKKALNNAKKQLNDKESSYQLLIDSVKDYAIFMLDAEGFITSWNTGAENLKGYQKSEIIGKHFSIFYPEEALQQNHPAYELRIAAEVGKYEEEGWRIRKDGSRFWANVVISAMFNPQNELVGYAKVTRDLTERKRLQDELKEREEQSRLLISAVKDYAIYMLTPEGKIASWNEGAKRIKGYEADEIMGCHFSKFYPSEAVSTQYPSFELVKALEDGRFEDEGWRLRKDGSRFWANVIITPVYNHQKQHIGFTKITRDLSEKLKNEELMMKNKELHRLNTDLDNFVYTASHDLKAPITNMEGLMILIDAKIRPKLDTTELRIINKMASSIERLQNTIASLLEVTKAQKNLEKAQESISVREILQEVKEEISPLIEEANAEFIEDLQAESITFTKASLRSILYNLLSNAIKYRSGERRVVINISTFYEKANIVLSVKDNGLGLTQENQNKLFSMFKRFHVHVEGTGIGLYIVKRTIENYGGKIEVNSKLNEGTEFKLYFIKQ